MALRSSPRARAECLAECASGVAAPAAQLVPFARIRKGRRRESTESSLPLPRAGARPDRGAVAGLAACVFDAANSSPAARGAPCFATDPLAGAVTVDRPSLRPSDQIGPSRGRPRSRAGLSLGWRAPGG